MLAMTHLSVLPSVILNTSAPGTILFTRLNGWPMPLPCRRFAVTLAGANARLGADADRYSFTVVDLHHQLFAGFTGAPEINNFGTRESLSKTVQTV